ncbi:MAG: DUF4147 domain-containing protein, partial [Gammaproteobacteria bacterium]|nr:DUF4147 domain-containing protein [Gammaproteobacteria bacterium]
KTCAALETEAPRFSMRLARPLVDRSSPLALKSRAMNTGIRVKTQLLQAWKTAVARVGGARVTRAAVAEDGLASITRLLAVGKAAAAMGAGALDRFAAHGEALVVTKYGHGAPLASAPATHARIELIEAGHPLPDENSLRAGRAVEEFVRATAAEEELVMLVSGGASALLELLPATVDLRALQTMTSALLAGGYAIDQINAARMHVSRIKGGKLLRNFGGRSARVYAVSDVPGDNIDIIGGGIGALGGESKPPPDIMRLLENMNLPGDATHAAFDSATRMPFDYRARIIASNRIARDAAAEFLRAHDWPVNANEESLNRDIYAAAQELAAALIAGPPGAYIWGGESTVHLPPKPGVGGRNQSLALALAKEIRGRRNIAALVAGSDGSDGPTQAAGALIDGDTFDAASGAERALARADAGAYLARIAALFKPGPTGTNVMDLAVAIKWQ